MQNSARTRRKASRSFLKVGHCEALRSVKRKKKRTKNKAVRTGSILTDSKFPLVRATAARFNMRCVDDWTLFWTDTFISVEACRALKPHQRVNRFPGVSAFACKDLLAQNLNRLYNAFPNRYKIFPRTWCLPHDFASITAYGISYPKKTFIIKPARGAEGRGIYITKNLKLIKPHDRMICQVYINRPFLIDGFKFDMRVYALISTINPLRIYVYNEGLTRFATKKYEEPASSNMNDKFMHLTNYSVNRRSAFYVHDQKAGTKRSISTLNKWFAKKGFNVKLIWASIDDAIIKTVLVSLPTLRRYYSECFPNHVKTPACFQILGFDMILDHKLKPYVLEVNHSPSMGTPTSLDAEVKSKLLYDTFRLLNLSKDDRDDADFAHQTNKFRVQGDRPHRMYNNNEPPATDPKMRAQFVRTSMVWEKRHLGNYRKVYPNKNVKRYKSILEYLNRLKWPTLHRLPPTNGSANVENSCSFKIKKRRCYSNNLKLEDEVVDGLKYKNEGEIVSDEEDAKESRSDYDYESPVEEIQFKRRQYSFSQLKSNEVSADNMNISALEMNILGKYKFINQIAYKKIQNNRDKAMLKTVKEENDETSSSAETQEYESANSVISSARPHAISSERFALQTVQSLQYG